MEFKMLVPSLFLFFPFLKLLSMEERFEIAWYVAICSVAPGVFNQT